MLNSSSSHYAGSNSLQPNISDSQLAQAARSTSPALDASAKFSTSTWRASPANVGTLRPNQIHQISVSSTLSNSQANAPSPSPRSASLSQHLNWDVARVSSWLSEIGMAKYCDTFSANHISGILLEDLDYDLLRELGVPTVGDQKRILMAIERLSTCPTFSFSFGIPSTPSTASPISRSASNDSGLRPQQMRDLFRTKGLREVALERGSSTSKRASSSLVIAPRSSSMKTGNTLDKSFKLSDYSADVGDLRAGWNSLESSILNMTGEPRIVVRVDGPGGESSNVDVSNLSDGPTIRQKIMKKFDLKGYPERETYILYLLGRDNPIDDNELLRLCKQSSPSTKLHFALKRREVTDFAATLRPENLRRLRTGNLDIPLVQGRNRALTGPTTMMERDSAPKPIYSNPNPAFIPTSASRGSSKSPITQYPPPPGFPPVPPADSKYPPPRPSLSQAAWLDVDPFGPSRDSDLANSSKKRLSKPASNARRSRRRTRLPSFFGERPPDEFLFENIENYFPALRQSQISEGPSESSKTDSSGSLSARMNEPLPPTPLPSSQDNGVLLPTQPVNPDSALLDDRASLRIMVQENLMNKQKTRSSGWRQSLLSRTSRISYADSAPILSPTLPTLSSAMLAKHSVATDPKPQLPTQSKKQEPWGSSYNNTIRLGEPRRPIAHTTGTPASESSTAASDTEQSKTEGRSAMALALKRKMAEAQEMKMALAEVKATGSSAPPVTTSVVASEVTKIEPNKSAYALASPFSRHPRLGTDLESGNPTTPLPPGDIAAPAAETSGQAAVTPTSSTAPTVTAAPVAVPTTPATPSRKEPPLPPTIEILSPKTPIVLGDTRPPPPPIRKWTQGMMIGQGAFGKVFHALNTETGEFFAVKQVLLGPISDANKKKRQDALQTEMELLKELDHVNIVRYLGFETKADSMNVFLEYVSGGSIASCLTRVGKFEEDLVRILSFQILSGLAYLHLKNIIHRDIKGGNILINEDGIAKISDFGTSKKNSADKLAYQRVTRMSMQGSIPWMAPEVARDKGYSAKVDIWSLGCLVLEMLTGFPPWHKVSGSVIYLLGTGKSPPLPDTISAVGRDFLQQCFIVDPDKRPRALDLLEHEFVAVDHLNFDFKAWVEALEAKKLEEEDDEEEEEDDGDENKDEDEGDDDEEAEELDEGEDDDDEDEREDGEDVEELDDVEMEGQGGTVYIETHAFRPGTANDEKAAELGALAVRKSTAIESSAGQSNESSATKDVDL